MKAKRHPLVLLACLAMLTITARAVEDVGADGWKPWEECTVAVTGTDLQLPARRKLLLSDANAGMNSIPNLMYDIKSRTYMLVYGVDYGHRGVFSKSTDGGDTWSTPIELKGIGLGFAAQLSDGRIVVRNGGCGRAKVTDPLVWHAVVSDDLGESWREVQTDNDTGRLNCYGLYTWDPVIDFKMPDGHTRIWSNGYSVIPCKEIYGGARQREYTLTRYSDDGGKSWSQWQVIGKFIGSGEAHYFMTSGNRLLVALREETESIVDHDAQLKCAYSDDYGESWSDPVLVRGPGRHHGWFAELPDGRIVLTYVVRRGYPPDAQGRPQYGVEAVISADGGRTWDTDHIYVLAKWSAVPQWSVDGGAPEPTDDWNFAPQSTSTIYNPHTGKLVTAYGTMQYVKYNVRGKGFGPRGLVLLEWAPPPLAK